MILSFQYNHKEPAYSATPFNNAPGPHFCHFNLYSHSRMWICQHLSLKWVQAIWVMSWTPLPYRLCLSKFHFSSIRSHCSVKVNLHSASTHLSTFEGPFSGNSNDAKIGISPSQTKKEDYYIRYIKAEVISSSLPCKNDVYKIIRSAERNMIWEDHHDLLDMPLGFRETVSCKSCSKPQRISQLEMVLQTLSSTEIQWSEKWKLHILLWFFCLKFSKKIRNLS